MRWAEKRIEQYKEGEKATLLEKMVLEHGHPINCVASFLAFIALGYGLWMHDFLWIGVGIVVGFFGHIYCWIKN